MDDSFAFVLLVYFAPSLVAGVRGHPDLDPIFMLNLILGWLVIPWFIALVWAFWPCERMIETG